MENKYLDYEGFEHTIERLRRKEMPEPGLDYVGQIVQYVGSTNPNFIKGCFYECVSDGEEPATYSWKLTDDAYDGLKQFELMPDASAAYSGEIVQYVGETYNDFTKGRFYECSKIPDTFSQVTPTSDDNPKANGWYEYDATHDLYKLTTDTAVDSEHTYYEVATFKYEWQQKNKSPYEVAVSENNYIGTENEWLKAINSDQGNAMFAEMDFCNIGSEARCDDFMCEYDNILYFGHGRELYKMDIVTKAVSKVTSICDLLKYSALQHYDDNGSPGIRGIAFYKNWMYVITRSQTPSLPSPLDDPTKTFGEIFKLDLSDYTVLSRTTYNGKGTDIKVYTASNDITYAVACFQMEFIKFYIVDPDTGTLIEKDTQYTQAYKNLRPDDYQPDIQEQQKATFFEKDGHVYVAAAGFADGVHVWDITSIDTERATLVCNWYSNNTENFPLWRIPDLKINPVPSDPTKPINPKTYKWFEFVNDNYVLTNDTSVVTDKRYYEFKTTRFHTFHCAVDYPYIYATLGPSSTIATPDLTYGTHNRRMGVLVIDISDFSHPVAKTVFIPVDDMCEYRGYDSRPTHIIMRKDKLFLNNGDRGIAVFDISKAGEPVYIGTKPLDGMIDISGMCVVDNYLYVGDDPVDNSGATYHEVIPIDHPVRTSDTKVETKHLPYYTYDSSTGEYTVVDNPSGNPKSQNWYAYQCPVDLKWMETKPYLDGQFRTTTDTKAVSGKRYYEIVQNDRFIKKLEIYEGFNDLFNIPEIPEPSSDVYGALIETNVMHDLGQYDSATSVNVKDLGAVGDGETDDSAAFIEALYEASAHGKVNILIPHGVYNLNHVSTDVTVAGVSLIGENPYNTVLLNNCWKAPHGITTKYLAFEGGTSMVIAHRNTAVTAIIDASPAEDTAFHRYENCIFRGSKQNPKNVDDPTTITYFGSIASQENKNQDYDGSTYHKIASDEIINCIFENFLISGVHHCITIDKVRIEGCTFRNIGYIDEVPFKALVIESRNTLPSSNVTVGTVYKYTGTTGTYINGEYYIRRSSSWDNNINPSVDTDWVNKDANDHYYKTTDTTFDPENIDTYYEPKQRGVGQVRLGDTSNNTGNTANECVIYRCLFKNALSNSFYYAPSHSDEANFVKIRAWRLSITHNKFKDLIGYAHDREGVYIKARNADISYNFIDNCGMGEGYICSKNLRSQDTDTDRTIYIHDNILVGDGGRAIRIYGNSVVENNTILIKNAKYGVIWGGNSYKIAIRNNNVITGIDTYVLSDEQSLRIYDPSNLKPTDYRMEGDKVKHMSLYLLGAKIMEITGNTIVASFSRSNYPSSDTDAHDVIQIQTLRQMAIIERNQIKVIDAETNNCYYTSNDTKVFPIARGIDISLSGSTTADNSKDLRVDINYNDIYVLYQPIYADLRGLGSINTKLSVVDNTIRNPEYLKGKDNKGSILALRENANATTHLKFSTLQKDITFIGTGGNYVRNLQGNVGIIDIEDPSWVTVTT